MTRRLCFCIQKTLQSCIWPRS